MSDPKKFPGMRWHPETGEWQIFQSAAEVPEGYLDYHPANPPEGAAVVTTAQAVVIPMDRKEIVKELSDGAIPFQKNAKTEVLYGVLVEALKAHLAASDVAFPDNATGPELLALVPKPE